MSNSRSTEAVKLLEQKIQKTISNVQHVEICRSHIKTIHLNKHQKIRRHFEFHTADHFKKYQLHEFGRKHEEQGQAEIESSNFEQNLKCEHAYHKRITYHAGA